MKATEAIHRLPYAMKLMVLTAQYPELSNETLRLMARGTGKKLLKALILSGFEPE